MCLCGTRTEDKEEKDLDAEFSIDEEDEEKEEEEEEEEEEAKKKKGDNVERAIANAMDETEAMDRNEEKINAEEDRE